MTANFGFIANAAERHPHVVAADRASDRASETGLTDAWRADKTDDRRAQFVAGEFAYGDVLDDAVLDLVEAVVIFVEDLARRFQAEVVFRFDRPGQLGQPFEIGADHTDLGRHRVLLLESFDLGECLLLHFLGHPARFDLVAHFARDRFLGRAFGEFFLNRPHLLAEIVLTLLAIHARLRFARDLLAEIEDIEPLLHHHAQLAQTLERIEFFQKFLALLAAELGGKRDHVGEPARLAHAANHRHRFFGNIGQHAHVVIELLQHRFDGRFGVGRIGHNVVVTIDIRHNVRILLDDVGDDATGDGLQHDVRGRPGAGNPLTDFGDHTNAAENPVGARSLAVRCPTDK